MRVPLNLKSRAEELILLLEKQEDLTQADMRLIEDKSAELSKQLAYYIHNSYFNEIVRWF